MISTNEQVEGWKFKWDAMAGKSHLNSTELNNYAASHFTQDIRRHTAATNLTVNLTQELSGINVRFSFYLSQDSNLTAISGPWIELLAGVPPTIFLNHSALYATHPGQNVSVCGNISGTPSPSTTIIRVSDQATLPPSSFNFNGTCWQLDSSAVKFGGLFTIVAKNCLSSISASFSIIVTDSLTISLDKNQPHEIQLQGNKNVSVCVNIRDFLTPIPVLTLIRPDRTMIPQSFYNYDGKCLAIHNSAVKAGGRFTIEVRNKVSKANTSFLVLGIHSFSINKSYDPKTRSSLSSKTYNWPASQRVTWMSDGVLQAAIAVGPPG
jgi:hypothetical protein